MAAGTVADRMVVLVVDDDPAMRRLVRTGLELEGVAVIEAASVNQARAVTDPVHAVVLDRDLPDGDGLDHFEELARRHDARVVVHSNRETPTVYPSVPKGDLDALLEALAVHTLQVEPDGAPDLARQLSFELIAEWSDLCRWDPEQPPDSAPPLAASVVSAVVAALERPQPLGWGLDPALEPVAETYALNSPALDVAVAQLVCLREAFERCVVDRLPATQQLDAARRLTMIIQRLSSVVVRAGVARLQAQAFTDPLTGLGNRRAFETDLVREASRAARHDRPLTVVALEVEGFDELVTTDGHAAGDEALSRLAGALTASLRSGDGAYRTEGHEFLLLLPDTLVTAADYLAARLVRHGAPPCRVAVATHPEEPMEALPTAARQRLRQSA